MVIKEHRGTSRTVVGFTCHIENIRCQRNMSCAEDLSTILHRIRSSALKAVHMLVSYPLREQSPKMSKGEVFRDVFTYLTCGDSSLLLPLGHLGLHALPFAAAACELHRSVVLRQVLLAVKAPTWDVARLGASELDWDADPLHLGSKFHESRLYFSATAVIRYRNL